MARRLGINGCGRIGRMTLRRALELEGLDVVAVNDVMPLDDLAYMIRYDSIHGRCPDEVRHDEGSLTIGERTIRCFSAESPDGIPWDSVGVDVVVESSGLFRGRDEAAGHLGKGVRKVLISAPSDDADVTLVPGVNEEEYERSRHDVVSMASCTTNSLAPVAQVLRQAFGIESLFITTVHAYTASQSLMDKPMRKRRRGRAGALSMIPTTTGATRATARVIPELEGKMDGLAIRVPVPDGSVTDIVARLERETDADEIRAALREASVRPPLEGILTVSDDELVSVDVIGKPQSAIVDGPSVRVLQGRTVKLLSWYDNEWGYACRLAELACRLN